MKSLFIGDGHFTGQNAPAQRHAGEQVVPMRGLVAEDLGADVLGDLYASAEYRKAVAPVWVRRALTAAADRA